MFAVLGKGARVLRRKWNLRKAEMCNFSFLMDQEGNASGQPIKWFTGNCSDIILLLYLSLFIYIGFPFLSDHRTVLHQP